MLMALLSMTFYKRVICHFLISEHSHMVPDRVISHVKRSFGTNDLYHPQDMIQKMSAVKPITGEFLDQNDPGRLLFIGWDKLLKEHLSPIPRLHQKSVYIMISRRAVNQNVIPSYKQRTINREILTCSLALRMKETQMMSQS